MKSICYFMLLLIAETMHAQQLPVYSALTLSTGYNGKDHVPFWIRSNNFGSIPETGPSLSLLGSVSKNDVGRIKKKTDWGFGLEGRINAGRKADFILTEAYAGYRYGILEVKGGRIKEITGLCDTLLSSGSWSISGNAPGIPKVEISIPDFYALPWFKGLFAFKGNYVNGWMGNWYIENKRIDNTPAYLHQKSLYGRLGRTDWKIKLMGGFNHQVVWVNEKNILFGEDYKLNLLQTFWYVNTGKRYNNGQISQTRIGNHVGSIDMAITYEFKKIELFVYRQNFYDAGALYYLANLLDGLNGICIRNKLNNHSNFHLEKFLIEFLHSKNQAGETWSRYTTSPIENYYNNGYYPAGWSYKTVGLGNPFITPATDVRSGLPRNPDDFFINNRVVALHLGVEGALMKWYFISKASYSRNYGTYHTAAKGKPYEGAVYPSPYGVFPVEGQFSGLISISRMIRKNFQIRFDGAVDIGGLFDNEIGLMASVTRII